MPKSNPDAWRSARLQWECDPKMTLTDVAARLGVALPTVSEKAKREAWMKVLPEAQSVEQAAADALGYISGRDTLLAATTAALDLSVATRVLVINRQRNDWAEHRRIFTAEAMASDPICAKRAKLTAEAMAIRQRGEAVAYGIVTMTGQSTDAPLVETVEEDGKPRAAWELLLESYATTGKAPDWAHQSGFQPPRIELDPNNEDNQ